MISDIYENYVGFGDKMDERQSNYFSNTVAPILLELFESINKSWGYAKDGNVPYDFEELKKDRRYRSILKTNILERKHYNEWVYKTKGDMEIVVKRLQKEMVQY